MFSPMRDFMDRTLYDGSTRKRYLELGNERIYKGFLLQTSVHFDLEAGPLGDKEAELRWLPEL